jgi:hypothetical protein
MAWKCSRHIIIVVVFYMALNPEGTSAQSAFQATITTHLSHYKAQALATLDFGLTAIQHKPDTNSLDADSNPRPSD